MNIFTELWKIINKFSNSSIMRDLKQLLIMNYTLCVILNS